MRIVVTGSIAYDYLMHYPGRFTDHLLAHRLDTVSLSFLVDSMVRQRGGVAANIAYTLKMLGGNPVILATVGQDFGDYRKWLEENGISTHGIIEIEDDFTASFFVSTDEAQNQIANFYTGAMAHARRFTLTGQGFTDADLVIVSPNDPEAMTNLARECRDLGIPFAYDPSQQTARLDGQALREGIPGARYLMVNAYELALIENKTGWTLDEVRNRVGYVIVTDGARGSTIFGEDGELFIPIAAPTTIKEPTGAGDAYRGGFFAAISAGLDHSVAGRVGALCSTYVLEHVGTANHRFGFGEFSARYEANFGKEPSLHRLADRMSSNGALNS